MVEQAIAVHGELSRTVQAEQRKIAISFDDVRKYLCPKASEPEIGLFLKVCQSEGLNPFAREVYLVKYADDEPAAIIIAIDAFLKAAETCEDYDGHEAGIILKKEDHRLEFREGTFMLDEEDKQLVGGWAKVYRRNRDKPFYAAVNMKEYKKYTRRGEPTRFWKEMPATMIRNVALRHALKEAFPNRFAGLYTTAEFEPVPEGRLPPAYTRNGRPDWPKFWARQKEKGLDEAEVHNILGVCSVKEDWIDKGRTLEEAEEIIDDALEKARQVSTESRELNTSAVEPESRAPVFQNWGQVAEAAFKLGVTSDDVFTQGKVKRWQDFPGYLDAWRIVEQVVNDRAQKPRLI